MRDAVRILSLASVACCVALAQSRSAAEREHPASGLPATLTGPVPSAPARAVVSGYTRMNDPIEQAFTVEVPSGWRSEAGLARLGLVHINPYVRALSPDKMTYLLFGEPTMPSFAPPTDIGMKLGIREGSLSSNGLDRVLVWHYLSGIQFARTYGQMALGQLCRDLKFVSVQERPDLASTMDKLLPTVIPSRSSGGEAVFSCMHNRQEMTARVEAVTRTTQDGVLWGPLLVQGLIAPKSQSNVAQMALNHIGGSIQFSPAWNQKQNALTQQANQAINARVAQQERQQAAFIEKLNAVDQNFQDVDELITGNSHYKDPRTGQGYFLNNANPFKWKDDYGRIVGTQTNNPPPFGYNYQLLQHDYVP